MHGMKTPVKSGLRIDSALAAIVARKKLTTAALARIGKTSQPTASRILNGAAVSGEVLAAWLSAMPDARAELARAHILDELERLGVAGLLSVSVSPASSARHSEVERLRDALNQQADSLGDLADLAAAIVTTAERLEARSRAAAGQSGPTAHEAPAPLHLVAEDAAQYPAAPRKKPRQKS